MKEKIFRILKQYVLTAILFIVLIGISGFLPYGNYCIIAILYIAFNYYMILGIVRMSGKVRSQDNLYEWLDVLDGSEKLIKRLVIHEKNKDVMSNLEAVFDKIMFFTNKDKRKLYLLKGYFKTLADEGPFDLFFKTLRTIIVAISAWGINKGFLFAISKENVGNLEKIVNPNYVVAWNYASILLLGIIALAVFIKVYFKEKTRIKIILEIIETCIEDIKDK
ncbi:hypothetical protein ACFVSW_20115 [Neobacillus sp. NPDC058068]|uniref:hypothetical protein n=1 Tax=Neobacillus sp. NPDC058068 TaxID=3346325 RepID=UPI0036D88C39